jgi:Xaa-Pro aminopeptidase
MILADSSALAARHTSVRGTMAAAGLDALVVTHVPNAFYLCNFTGTAAIAVITGRDVRFITDFRYLTALTELQSGDSACPDLVLERVDQSYEQTLAAVLADLAVARIGYEAAHLTVSRLRWLEAALDWRSGAPELVATEGFVERARLRKDSGEQAILREAAQRLSAVLVGVLADLHAGMVETEVALALETGMRRSGFTRPAFDTIVASGAASALPHARAGARRLAAGDLVVLDFGGVYNGYCVDLTRTVSIGPPSPEAVHLYEAVRRAQGAALAAVRPGVALTAVDMAARESLTSDGYGAAFGHGTGHGLGIEVHEAPRVARATAASPTGEHAPTHVPDAAALDPGMVLTIEPGAYIPGFGGVRIEDDVLVIEEGCEVLTTVDRELRVC